MKSTEEEREESESEEDKGRGKERDEHPKATNPLILSYFVGCYPIH